MFELSPWMIDAILFGVVAEFFLFRSLLIKAGARQFITPLFLFLVSGGFLLIALRLTMADASALLISFALLLAFASHAAMLSVAAARFLPGRRVS